MTIPEMFAGALILICLIIIAYLLLGSKPVSFTKTVGKRNTSLSIRARRNIHKLSVKASFGGERITFERKRVRKDQTVDFVYPSSKDPAKLIIEVVPGKKQEYDV